MDHSYQDAVSLELATRVANGLSSHPEWIAKARENLARWSRQNANAPWLLRCYEEWRRILDNPVDEVCRILLERSDEGQRLRQSSPFAGVVHYRQVWEIKRRIRAEMMAAEAAERAKGNHDQAAA